MTTKQRSHVPPVEQVNNNSKCVVNSIRPGENIILIVWGETKG